MNTGAVKMDQRFVKFGTPGFADVLALPSVSGPHSCGERVTWTAPLFIECKTEKGRQSLEQKVFERTVKDAGAEYIIVRSIEELEKWMLAHDVRGVS
jgi:hypothetical protein